MPEQDFGLLSDTGRELYVADAINDLTRLRLQLASATLAGIADRPEWGGIAASLRALGEDHPATVVDAFADVLKAVGEESHAGEDHEFLAYGTPTQDLPDPVARAVAELRDQVAAANARIAELERQRAEPATSTRAEGAEVTPLRRHAEG
jgi:hypothetical protein